MRRWATQATRPDRFDIYDEIGMGSLPRDKRNFLDEREIIRLCGKAKLHPDSLYEMFPHEFIFYIEGYLEDEREYFEYMNYSLFSSIRQALGKGKKFSNPFEKQKMQPDSVKLTEEEYESEVDAIKEIFGI